MKPFTQQSALKGLLFVALAANVSWGTMKTMSSDFASDGEIARGGQGRASTPPDGVSKTQPPKEDTARRGNDEMPVDRPTNKSITFRADKAPAVEFIACDRKFHTRSMEITTDKTVTRVIVEEITTRVNKTDKTSAPTEEKFVKEHFHIDFTGSDVDNFGSPDVKASNDKHIIAEAKRLLCPQTSTAEDKAAKNAEAETELAKDKPKTKDDRDQERIAEGQEKCRLDSKGNDLDAKGKVECYMKQLSRLKVDTKKNDKRAESEALREMEKIASDLRTSIRDIMFGKVDREAKRACERERREASRDRDEDRGSRRRDREDREDIASACDYQDGDVEEGMDLADEAADLVQDIGDDLLLSEKKVNVIAKKIRSLKTAGKLRLATNEAREESLEIRENWLDAKQEYNSASDDWSKMLAQQNMMKYENQARTLGYSLNNMADARQNGIFAQVEYLKGINALDKKDYRPFAEDFKALRRSVNNLAGIRNPNSQQNPSGSGDRSYLPTADQLQAPDNISDIRSRLYQDFRTNYNGLEIPTSAPTIDFANHGSAVSQLNLRQPTPMFNSASSLVNPNTGRLAGPNMSPGATPVQWDN